MGQEKDVLIIKSDKKWKEFFIDRIVYFIIWVIGFDAMITYWIVVSGSIKGIDIAIEYYGAAEPPVRCGESHLSGLTEPPQFVY